MNSLELGDEELEKYAATNSSLQESLAKFRNVINATERFSKIAEVNALEQLKSSVGDARASGEAAMHNEEMTSPSREEMKHALQATQSDVSAIAEKLRADFAEQRGDMKAAVETLRADMHKASADNIKWVIGTMIALLAVTISVLSFVINNAAKVPQAQQPQQQPVIVNVLPATTTSAAPQQSK